MKNIHSITLCFALAFLSVGCKKSDKKSLEEVEKIELSRGVRNDYLFLGMSLGMTAKEFYDVCWGLNKKGILREGDGNMTAAYQLDSNQLKFPAQMDFYPTFTNEKISAMPLRFAYKGWAPWNPELQSDKLIFDVKALMGKWFGNEGFFVVPLAEGQKGIAKVDGNRRIIISIFDDRIVKVDITDLTQKK